MTSNAHVRQVSVDRSCFGCIVRPFVIPIPSGQQLSHQYTGTINQKLRRDSYKQIHVCVLGLRELEKSCVDLWWVSVRNVDASRQKSNPMAWPMDFIASRLVFESLLPGIGELFKDTKWYQNPLRCKVGVKKGIILQRFVTTCPNIADYKSIFNHKWRGIFLLTF